MSVTKYFLAANSELKVVRNQLKLLLTACGTGNLAKVQKAMFVCPVLPRQLITFRSCIGHCTDTQLARYSKGLMTTERYATSLRCRVQTLLGKHPLEDLKELIALMESVGVYVESYRASVSKFKTM